MTENSLLEKAIADYNAAITLRETYGGDELYLNIEGYLLQQSVELAIKHVLEHDNVEYEHTHIIELLLDQARENGIDILSDGYIEDHSEMLTSWEARTRYIKNYHVEQRKIDDAIRHIGRYLEKVAEYDRKEIDQAKETPSRTQKCHNNSDEADTHRVTPDTGTGFADIYDAAIEQAEHDAQDAPISQERNTAIKGGDSI